MDIYKEKFTSLQREIFRFLSIKAGRSFNQRQLAKYLKVSPTAIAKSLVELGKQELININKEEESNRIIIELNLKNPKTIYLKKIENLYLLSESGVLDHLSEQFPLSTIILFGSYSKGEDIERSDIDIAILDTKERKLKLEQFENKLEKKINIEFINLKSIKKELRNSVLSGVTLKGYIEL